MNPTILELRKLPRRFLALEVAATIPVGPPCRRSFAFAESSAHVGAGWREKWVFARSFLELWRLAAQEVSWFQAPRVG